MRPVLLLLILCATACSPKPYVPEKTLEEIVRENCQKNPDAPECEYLDD